MVVKRGNLLVPLDRNPLEIFLLALCVVTGISNLIRIATDGPSPGSATPPLLSGTFYAMLILGGLGGIAGAYWRDAITGVLIVRASMIPVAASSLAYAIGFWYRGGALLTSVIIAAFAGTCAWRAWQITKHVRDESKRVIVRPAGDPPKDGAQ